VADHDLTAWTPGEALWLWRLGLGLNQADAARYLGVNHSYLSEMERDRRDVPPRAASIAATGLRRRPPTLSHLLRLARRRAGRSYGATAAALGVSRMALSKAERGGWPKLRGWWEGQGYRFDGTAAPR
jgi:transcriptional regulator with XRE-family HTH domain